MSRLEREFSLADSQPSQATTMIESTTERCSPTEEIPDGTVYFHDSTYFQEFSGFQKKTFLHSSQDPNFQHFSQDPHLK